MPHTINNTHKHLCFTSLLQRLRKGLRYHLHVPREFIIVELAILVHIAQQLATMAGIQSLFNRKCLS